MSIFLLSPFLQGVSIAQQSPVLALSVRLSVRQSLRLSVRYTLALCQNDASYDHEIFTDG